MIFRRRKKKELGENKPTFSNQMNQFRQERKSNESPDYCQSPQDLLNALISAHLAQSTGLSNQRKKEGKG